MKLKASPPSRPRPVFVQIRETPEVVKSLADEAASAGIVSTEALRQIIADYNAHPFEFAPPIRAGRKTHLWSNIKSDQATVDTFTAHARRQGVSVAEAIRQCVRRYLKAQGRI